MPFELTKTKEFNDTFENVYKSLIELTIWF